MNTKRAQFSMAALLSVLSSACASVDDQAPREPVSIVRSGSLATAVNGLQTVAIHPRGRLIGVHGADAAWELRSVMDSQIQARFIAKGYEVVAPAKANMLVAYAVGASDQITDVELQEAFGVSAGLDIGSGKERGAIVIAIVRRATNSALWRASASGASRRGEISSDERDESLRAAVAELLTDLPRAR